MKFYKEELSRLESELEQLEFDSPMMYIRAEKGIALCRNTLLITRERVIKKGFKNPEEECLFFKTIKPKIVGYLIHFMNLVNIERHQPLFSGKERHKFYIQQISLFRAYFLDNREIYEYYIRNLSHLDLEYFTRNPEAEELYCDSLVSIIDTKFSTPKDMVFAKIVGHTHTINYLKNKLLRKKRKHFGENKNIQPLKWTGAKVDLVELVYALQASNMINNGNAGIKEIAKGFEDLFSIQLGDYYRIFLEIRMRKNNQTKLLDFLKTCMQNKIVEADG